MVERLMKFKPHEAIPSLAKESEAQSAYAVLEGQARQFAAKLGFAIEEGESVWNSFGRRMRTTSLCTRPCGV